MSGNARYVLAEKIDNGNSNELTFKNSNVRFGSDDYAGSTVYGFSKGSVIDLISNSTRTVRFGELNIDNAFLDFSIRFDKTEDGAALLSDKLITERSSGTLNIGRIKVLNDDDSGLNRTYSVTVLEGIVFDGPVPGAIATSAYEYGISFDDDKTGISLSVMKESDENSLNAMNIFAGNRVFNFSFFDSQPSVYKIGASLSSAAAGAFSVQGYNNDASRSVISGVLYGSSWEKGSLFNIANDTDLYVYGLTAEDFYIDGSGSFLRVSGSSATAHLENTVVKNNVSSSRGGAVNISAESLDITDSVFENNAAGRDGGALYVEFANVTISAVNSESVFRDNAAGSLPNDIYLGEGTVLNLNASNKDIRIESGILSGPESVNAEINKTGQNRLYLGGRNDLRGGININEGELILSRDSSLKSGKIKTASEGSLNLLNGKADTVETSKFKNDGTLKIEIFQNGSNDKIIAGNAALGGNLYVQSEVGTYENMTFTILHSTSNPFTGTFVSSSVSGPGLNFKLDYSDGNMLKLIINGIFKSGFAKLGGLSYNQKETARTLDLLSETAQGDLAAAITGLTRSSETVQREALRQLSGYFIANVIRSAAYDYENEVYARIAKGKTGEDLWAKPAEI